MTMVVYGSSVGVKDGWISRDGRARGGGGGGGVSP